MKRRPAHLRTRQEEPLPAPKARPALIRVPICQIRAQQMEKQDETLPQLCASIARHGLLQPIVVRRERGAAVYALVLGRRRLAACRMLGMQEVDALLIAADAAEAAACALEDGATRAADDVLELACKIARTGVQRVTAACALPAGEITRLLSLLRLAPGAQRIIRLSRLTLEQAEPLLHVKSERMQTEAAMIIAQRSLTAQQARRLVSGPNAEALRPGIGRRRAVYQASREIHKIVHDLSGSGVCVQMKTKEVDGRLQMMIEF